MNRIVSALWAAGLSASAITASAGPPLSVLVITGTHEFDQAAFDSMFATLDGMECTIQDTGTSPGALFASTEAFPYDAIVLYNFRQTLTAADQANFKALLDRGIGLTVLHHAIAGFPGWVEYENIIGATYVLEEQTRGETHYPRPQWKHGVDMKIAVEDPDHPITRGVEDFITHDEAYKGWVYHDGNQLLLATDNEHSNRQIAWTRDHPKARVFFMQLGHDKHAFEHPQYRRVLRQAIAWTTER